MSHSPWALEFIENNENAPDWTWAERLQDNGLLEVVGISGTKYAVCEVMPISIVQAKQRIVLQVAALERLQEEKNAVL